MLTKFKEENHAELITFKEIVEYLFEQTKIPSRYLIHDNNRISTTSHYTIDYYNKFMKNFD